MATKNQTPATVKPAARVRAKTPVQIRAGQVKAAADAVKAIFTDLKIKVEMKVRDMCAIVNNVFDKTPVDMTITGSVSLCCNQQTEFSLTFSIDRNGNLVHVSYDAPSPYSEFDTQGRDFGAKSIEKMVESLSRIHVKFQAQAEKIQKELAEDLTTLKAFDARMLVVAEKLTALSKTDIFTFAVIPDPLPAKIVSTEPAASIADGNARVEYTSNTVTAFIANKVFFTAVKKGVPGAWNMTYGPNSAEKFLPTTDVHALALKVLNWLKRNSEYKAKRATGKTTGGK